MSDGRTSNGVDPLILTLALDEASQDFFDRQRTRYFPPDRNHLAAHLTLFHSLPGDQLPAIRERLASVAAGEAPLLLEVSEVISLGRGSAYRIESERLEALRETLAEGWRGWLTRQDASGFRPHVTVQNKVGKEEAEATRQALEAAFQPFQATGTALALWHYRGGPWDPAGRFPLRPA